MADDKIDEEMMADDESAPAAGIDPAFFGDEEEDDEWGEAPRARGITMRHPVLLVLVIAGSVFMFVKTWPKVAYMIDAQTPAECGDLSMRPINRIKAPDDVPPLTHDTHCHVRAHVQKLSILATGEPREGDPYQANVDRKYYLKLDGDKVIGVVDAGRKDIVDYRLRRGNLLGFEINTTGRMIDPDQLPEMRATAKTLRVKFAIPDSEPIRIFDTTQQPGDRWPYAIICVLMVLTSLLASFGLLRLFRARREED